MTSWGHLETDFSLFSPLTRFGISGAYRESDKERKLPTPGSQNFQRQSKGKATLLVGFVFITLCTCKQTHYARCHKGFQVSKGHLLDHIYLSISKHVFPRSSCFHQVKDARQREPNGFKRVRTPYTQTEAAKKGSPYPRRTRGDVLCKAEL